MNHVRNLVRSPLTRTLALAVFMTALMAVAAAAQAPATPDYAVITTSAKNELYNALTAVGPIVFLVMAVVAGIGWAFRMVRRATKSS